MISIIPLALFILIIIIFMSHTKTTPKDVFLHLFNIVTFYLMVVGFIMLFIQYINAIFPDPLNYYYNGIASGVRVASAILLIAVPSYILTAWLVNKDVIIDPEKKELPLRKWLTYLTLFASALTSIIDLMIFVYYFLEGELSIRFFLKVVVVLILAAAVFGYYMWDLKRKDLKTSANKILAIILGVAVIGSVIAGFFIIGTPGEQRNKRLDEQRVNDLQMIQGEVINYWTQKEKLPTELSDLQDSITGFVAPNDPVSRGSYEYIIKTDLSFELCANFLSANLDEKNGMLKTDYYSPYNNVYNQNWIHDSGRVCFERTIDPELYKDKEKLLPEPMVIR